MKQCSYKNLLLLIFKIIIWALLFTSVLLMFVLKFSLFSGGGKPEMSIIAEGYLYINLIFKDLYINGINHVTFSYLGTCLLCLIPFHAAIICSILLIFKKIFSAIIVATIPMLQFIVLCFVLHGFVFLYYPGSILWIPVYTLLIIVYCTNKKSSIFVEDN